MRARKPQGQDFASIATMEKLLEIGQSLVIARDLESLLQKTTESAGSVLGADVIVLYEYQEDASDVIVPPVIYGELQYPDILRETSRVRPHKESAVFTILGRAAPFYASNARKDWGQLIADWSQETGKLGNFVHREGIASSAAVPLTAGERRVGVIFVNYRTPHAFLDDERRAIELFAAQAALAICNARLFHQVEEHVEQLSALIETGQVINRSLDMNSILEPVFEQALSLVGEEAGWIALVDRETQILRIVASRGIPHESIQAFHERPTYGYEGTFGLVTQTGEIQESLDAQHDKHIVDVGLPIPEQLTNIPLKVSGQVIGILTLDALIPNEQARQSLGALANMTAVAIEKARLLERNAGLIRELKQRNEELEALNKIGRDVSTLSLEEVLRSVYEQTSQLMETTNFFIGLYDPRNEKINMEIWMHEEQPLQTFTTGLSGLTGWIIREKKPLLIRDWDKEESGFPVRAKIVTGRQRSWLGVPLIIGEEILGVVSVQSPHPNAFDSDDQRILEIIANQATAAIQSARLFEEGQRRLKLLNALHETSLDIVRALELEELLPAIIERAANLMTGEHPRGIGAAYWRCDHETQRAIIEYSPNPALVGVELGFDEGLAGEVIQTGEARSVNDYPEWAGHAAVFDREDLAGLVKNVIDVPVKEDDRVVAILAVSDATGQRPFDDTDVELLERFADLAAIAIENARLHKDLQRRVRGLEMLNQVAGRISRSVDRQDIFQAIVEAVYATVDSTHCTLFLLDDKEVLIPQATAGVPLELIQKHHFRLGEGLAGWVAQQGESILVRDANKDQRFVPGLTVMPGTPRSLVLAPLRAEGQIIGVISADQDRVAAFEENDRQLLDTLSAQAGIAIHNADLFIKERLRANTMSLLQRVSARVSSAALDLEKTLDMIIEGAMELTGTDSGVIHLIEDARQGIIRSYEVPEGFGHLPSRFAKKTGMTWEAFNKGQTIAVPDITKDDRINPLMATKGVRACIGTPLKIEGRTIGVLFLNNSDVHEFTEYDEALLSTLADQATIAIQNVRLLQREQRRADTLSLLQRVSATISGATGIKEALAFIAEGALQLTGLDSGVGASVIHVIDEAKQVISHSYAFSTDIGHLPSRFSKRRGLTWRIFSTGEIVEIRNVPKSRRVSRGLAESGVKSLIGVPLKLDSSVMGALFLNSYEQRDFTDDEKSLLTMLAEQAALAIDKTRRYEQRVQDISALEEINQAILERELDEVTQLIAERAKTLTEADYATLRLADESGKYLVLRAVRGRKSKEDALPIDENSFTGWTAVTGHAALCPDVKRDRHYVEWYSDIKSCMAAPLKREEQVIGTLYVESTQLNAFSEQFQLDLLQSLANQAAIAIENAQLVRELERRNTRLVRLQEISAAISAEAADVNKVLGLIVDNLSAMFEGASCAVRLYDPDSNEFGDWAATGALKDWWGTPRLGGTSWFVINTESPLYIEDTTDSPSKGRPSVRQEFTQRGVESIAYLPLSSKGTVTGIQYLNLTTPHRFTRNDKQILRLFADHASIAIENAQLYEQRLKDITALQDINEAVVSSPLDKVLDLIVQKAVEVMPGEYGELWLKEPTTDDLVLQAACGPAEAAAEEIGRLKAGAASVNMWVAEKGRPKICEDTECVEAEVSFYRIYQVARSSVTVPLQYRNKVIGTLNVESARLKAFSEQHAHLLDSFADQAAIAIENARAREELAREQYLMRTLMNSVPDAIYFKDLETRFIRVNKATAGERWFNLSDPAQVIGKTDFDFFTEEHAQQANEDEQEVMRTGQPLVGIEEKETWPNGQETWASTTKMPLRDAQGNTIGTFGISRDITERKQAKEALQKRATQLERLQKVTTTISAEPPNLDNILRLIASSLGDIFQGTACSIRLYDSKTGKFDPMVATGVLKDLVDHPPRPDGASHYVVHTRTPRYLEETDLRIPPDGGPTIRQDILERGVKAIAYLPLISEGDVVGVLYVDFLDWHRFSDDEKRILELFADQASIAIENTRLFEQLNEEKKERINTIRDIGFGITASTDLDQVLDGLLQKTIRLMREASSGEIWLSDEETGKLKVRASKGVVETEVTGINIGEGIVGRVAETERPHLAGNVEEDPHFVRRLAATQSELAVPLFERDRLIGVLNIEHPEPNAFVKDDIPLLQAIASQAAIAIENARLYYLANRKISDLRAINQVGQTLTSSIVLSEEQVLNLIYKQAKELMDTSDMYVALYEPDPTQPDKPHPEKPKESVTHGTVRFGLAMNNDQRVDTEREDGWGPRKAGQGLTEYVIRTKEPYRPADVGKAYRTIAKDYIGKIPKSWMGVPMMVENTVLGVVVLRNDEHENVYAEDDEEVLQAIAGQSAIALQNARLVQQLEQRVRELGILQELAEGLSGSALLEAAQPGA